MHSEVAVPPVRVVYDEGRVVVVAKESGVTVEEVARLLGKKLVHRIDKETSGLVMLADDARTVQRMQRALRSGEVARGYLFVAHGVVAAGAIESELVRDRGDGLRGSAPAGVVVAGGKRARTVVTPAAVAPEGAATLATAALETGRTHQIRIHLAESGHPLAGERVYIRDHKARGLPLLAAPRLLLHAGELRFTNPTTKAPASLALTPPPDFVDAVRALGLPWPPVAPPSSAVPG